MLKIQNRHASSFRDPSGAMVVENGILYRVVNLQHYPLYKTLAEGGFYKKLFDNGLLIPHEEVEDNGNSVRLKPQLIPFFSYPYEWSFSMYKHAALHTLKLQKYCLQHGYTLKDATAFNITFHKGAPVFADTLSFDEYKEGQPWRAYRQFITHFLSPLVLARYYGSDMLKLMAQYIDGIPLARTVDLLPFYARFNATVYANIYLAAKYDARFSGDKGNNAKEVQLPKEGQLKILDALYNYIKGLELKEKTEWKDYYTVTNYDDAAFNYKKQLIKDWCSHINACKIIDLGGNDGTFSREVADTATEILVTDIDSSAVDYNYMQVLKNKETNILPLVSDLLNPSPGIGFNNSERQSLLERIRQNSYDVTFALALIHHVSLTGNVPFDMSAKLFASLSPYLIIEFPDREDSWVQFLLKSKREFMGHFEAYNLDNFEAEYSLYFNVLQKQVIPGTHRTMYLLQRKEPQHAY